MFYSLTGTVVHSDLNSLALDCNGIAFRCQTSLQTVKQAGAVGSRLTLYTYLSVREDAMELFGFADKEELNCFKLLISVSGVGPKAAVSVLSEMTPSRLALCIAAGDTKSITKAQNIGPKIAQRIVLELKDKIAKAMPAAVDASQLGSITDTINKGNAAEAVSALTSLGYTQTDAAQAVSKLDPLLSVEEMIRIALRGLAKGV